MGHRERSSTEKSMAPKKTDVPHGTPSPLKRCAGALEEEREEEAKKSRLSRRLKRAKGQQIRGTY